MMNEEKKKSGVYAVIMASGRSSRYGRDKLWEDVGGRPVIERTVSAVLGSGFDGVIVVSRDRRITELARSLGANGIYNPDETDDTAETIRLGVSSLPGGAAGCALFVADQPLFTSSSADGLIDLFLKDPERICAVCFHGERGNPVIFPRSLFPELIGLPKGGRGKNVIMHHPNLLTLFEVADGHELWDVDTEEDMEKVRKSLSFSKDAFVTP